MTAQNLAYGASTFDDTDAKLPVHVTLTDAFSDGCSTKEIIAFHATQERIDCSDYEALATFSANSGVITAFY